MTLLYILTVLFFIFVTTGSLAAFFVLGNRYDRQREHALSGASRSNK